MSNKHEDWLRRATGDDSFRSIEAKTGINYNAIGRDLREKSELSADRILAIANGYGIDPVQALRDTGHLPQHPQEETPEQLAQRIKADVDRLAGKITQSNIIPLHAEDAPGVTDHFYNQETPTDFPFEEAVAKNSEDLDSWEEDDNTP